MKPVRLLVLTVAAGAAVAAGFVAKNMVSRPAPQAVVHDAQPQIKLDQVLVASQDIGIGGDVGNSARWQEWPAGSVSSGYILRSREPDAITSIKGATARMPMLAGEPIQREKLIGAGQSLMSSILPSGMRAIATQISADTSAGGFILPNDYVDVIMTRHIPDPSKPGGSTYDTETILQNIRVLAIDQTIQEDGKGNKVTVGKTATLELTPEQAEIITVAQQMADRLTLALRSIKDVQEPVGPGAEYLVNGAGHKGTVRLIKSGAVTEVGARE
jgi:pilus assembly protein CpaB